MKKISLSILFITILWALLDPLAYGVNGATSPRGYQPQPCGFDLNDNGVIGEPSDCNICDGVTSDPDSDGVNEDLLYVDAQIGSDASGNGLPQNPYRTIQYALNRADGPADGAEDIVCFRGIAQEGNLSPKKSGVAGFRTKPKSGSEAGDFQFPLNPTMLVGWDSDNDGQYPPFDTDDVAVLEGGGVFNRAIRNSSAAAISYIEYAHFTAQNYTTAAGGDGGFIDFGFQSPTSSHVYLHDLSLLNILKDLNASDRLQVFMFYLGGTSLHYAAIVNVEVLNHGGYLARGGGGEKPKDPPIGPVRFQNLTTTAKALDNGWVHGFKLWGYISGVEVLAL